MTEAVRSMVSRSLGALIFRNAELAAQVLESDDMVDQYRDQIFDTLLHNMTEDVALVTPGMQFVLATRHLERIADHATNIAEDIIFWVRGLDVRHGRGLMVRGEAGDARQLAGQRGSGHQEFIWPSFSSDSGLRHSARLFFTPSPTLGTGAPLAPAPSPPLPRNPVRGIHLTAKRSQTNVNREGKT